MKSKALPHATRGGTLNTVPSETPDTQGHTVCDPIFVTRPQQAHPQCGSVGAEGWEGVGGDC